MLETSLKVRTILRQRSSLFWTTVDFEIEYLINEDTEGVLTDAVCRGNVKLIPGKLFSSFKSIFAAVQK